MAGILDEGGVTAMVGKLKRLSAAKNPEVGSSTSHHQGHEGLSTHMGSENVGKKVKGAKKLVTWTITLITEEHGTEVTRVELVDDVFGKTKVRAAAPIMEGEAWGGASAGGARGERGVELGWSGARGWRGRNPGVVRACGRSGAENALMHRHAQGSDVASYTRTPFSLSRRPAFYISPRSSLLTCTPKHAPQTTSLPSPAAPTRHSAPPTHPTSPFLAWLFVLVLTHLRHLHQPPPTTPTPTPSPSHTILPPKVITVNGHPVHPREFKDKQGYAFMFDYDRYAMEVHIKAKPESKTVDGHYILYMNRIPFGELTYGSLISSMAKKKKRDAENAAADAAAGGGGGGGGWGQLDQKTIGIGAETVTVGVPVGEASFSGGGANTAPFQVKDTSGGAGGGGLDAPLLDLNY